MSETACYDYAEFERKTDEAYKNTTTYCLEQLNIVLTDLLLNVFYDLKGLLCEVKMKLGRKFGR